jgi:hypothetical protein
MTAYGRTKTGTVVHLLDDPRGFGAYRARCGVHLDALVVLPVSTDWKPWSDPQPACANCNAVLPMGPRRRP